MIIVTGATGFIGSNIIKNLNLRLINDIIAVDSFKENPHKLNRYINKMSIKLSLDKEELIPWIKNNEGVECIIHMGARSNTMEDDTHLMMKLNYFYPISLWEVCSKKNIPFIYASSAATYGDGSLGYDDNISPINLKPLNVYGQSKNLFDIWALRQTDSPPFWAGLKFFNVYGINESHKGKMSSVVFNGFNQINKSGKLKLFMSDKKDIKHGHQCRDFIFIEDVVSAIFHFISKSKSDDFQNGLYNIGTGHERTFEDLGKSLFCSMKLKENIEYIPMPDGLGRQYQYFSRANINKLINSGFDHMFHSLEHGIDKYVKTMIENKSN